MGYVLLCAMLWAFGISFTKVISIKGKLCCVESDDVLHQVIELHIMRSDRDVLLGLNLCLYSSPHCATESQNSKYWDYASLLKHQ